MAIDWMDEHPDASDGLVRAAIAAVPSWQWAVPGGFWGEMAERCPDHARSWGNPKPQHGPGNRLGINTMDPTPRCLWKSPDGLGLRWLMSGGSPLAYGICSADGCPWRLGVKGVEA